MKNSVLLKNLLFVIFVMILAVPAILPLFKSGFIITDDGGWMIIRLSAFYDTLRDGQFPARFLERINFGYGYPVSNFLYPGYLYLGSVIHILGFSFIDTVKILFGSSLILSGIFSFIWLRRLFGNLDSLLGSLVFVYSPYHLFDIYKRGSLGEALSISIIPLAFYGIEKASTILVGLSVFLILILHNTLAIFFLPLIPIYAIIRKSFVRSIPGMGLGVAMSAFFTVPAIVELRYTKFFETKISNPLEYFADTNLIGIVSIVVLLSSIILMVIIYKKEIKKIPYFGLVILFGFLAIVSLVLSVSLSSLFWENINASFVQFPYRILSIFILCVSFFAAFISYILFEKAKILVVIIISILTIYSSYNYLTNVEYSNNPDEFYSTNEATTTIHNEYMPIWVKNNPSFRPENKVEVLSGDAEITNLKLNSSKIEFETKVVSDSRVRVNTIYWPGWMLFVEGEQRPIFYDNDFGVMEFELSQYDDRVYLAFQEDLVRTLSNMVSIVAALALIYFISRPLVKF